MIASAPTDLERVLQAIVETAARLCEAPSGALLEYRAESQRLVPRAVSGRSSVIAERDPSTFQQSPGSPATHTSAAGHAFVDRRTVHVLDMAEAVQSEYPDSRRIQALIGSRTVVYVPLLRQGTPIGVLSLQRQEVRPYSEQQIRLVETFADQAVIAIENARLFEELEQRNGELQESNRQVSEALEQQTATSEILRVIASSPTDVQPVLDAVAERAARLCDTYFAAVLLVEGDIVRTVASYVGNLTDNGGRPLPAAFVGPPLTPDGGRGNPLQGSVTGWAVRERRTIHVHDVLALPEAEFPYTYAVQRNAEVGDRTMLAVPMIREGVAMGTILLRRMEVRPFSEQQVTLLETFADQAVIAIENARLFEELEQRNAQLSDALEQQTATADVLRVIASSPTDLQQVLDAIAGITQRLCDADVAWVQREVDGHLRTLSRAGGLTS